jgi:hypothetical protein
MQGEGETTTMCTNSERRGSKIITKPDINNSVQTKHQTKSDKPHGRSADYDMNFTPTKKKRSRRLACNVEDLTGPRHVCSAQLN